LVQHKEKKNKPPDSPVLNCIELTLPRETENPLKSQSGTYI